MVYIYIGEIALIAILLSLGSFSVKSEERLNIKHKINGMYIMQRSNEERRFCSRM